MRLFVAADLPEPVRRELRGHGRALADAGGWRALPAEALHVTLAFLGERDEREVVPIADAVGGAVAAVGRIEEVGLGDPLRLPPRRPRVAAVMLEDPSGRLQALQAAVAGALVALGVFAPERRRYLAHVTVARRARGELGDVDPPAWGTGRFAISGVSLYVSRLSPRGARYEALASFPG